MTKLTHINDAGKANMVDVGDKPVQKRVATASGHIVLQPATLELIQQNNLKKGDVLATARIAGIQAAKQTALLIPLCHTLLLTKVEVEFELLANGIEAKCTVKCNGKTGVEMEALTAVSTALLTIYDMCKAVDKTMVISNVQLLEKTKE